MEFSTHILHTCIGAHRRITQNVGVYNMAVLHSDECSGRRKWDTRLTVSYSHIWRFIGQHGDYTSVQGRPGLVVTRVSCKRRVSDNTANGNKSARYSPIYLSLSCIQSIESVDISNAIKIHFVFLYKRTCLHDSCFYALF